MTSPIDGPKIIINLSELGQVLNSALKSNTVEVTYNGHSYTIEKHPEDPITDIFVATIKQMIETLAATPVMDTAQKVNQVQSLTFQFDTTKLNENYNTAGTLIANYTNSSSVTNAHTFKKMNEAESYNSEQTVELQTLLSDIKTSFYGAADSSAVSSLNSPIQSVLNDDYLEVSSVGEAFNNSGLGLNYLDVSPNTAPLLVDSQAVNQSLQDIKELLEQLVAKDSNPNAAFLSNILQAIQDLGTRQGAALGPVYDRQEVLKGLAGKISGILERPDTLAMQQQATLEKILAAVSQQFSRTDSRIGIVNSNYVRIPLNIEATEIYSLKTQIQELTKANQVLTNQIPQLLTELEAKTVTVGTSESNLAALNTEKADLTAQLKTNKQALTQNLGELEASRAEVVNLKEANTKNLATIVRLETELKQNQATLTKAKAQFATELLSKELKINTPNSQLVRSKQEITCLKSILAANTLKIAELEKSSKSELEALEKSKKELLALQGQKVAERDAAFKDLNSTIEQLKAEILILKKGKDIDTENPTRIASLEKKIHVQEAVLALQTTSVSNIQTTHGEEVAQLKAKIKALEAKVNPGVEAYQDNPLKSLILKNEELKQKLEASEQKEETLRERISSLTEENKAFTATHAAAIQEKELQNTQLSEQIRESTAANQQLSIQLEEQIQHNLALAKQLSLYETNDATINERLASIEPLVKQIADLTEKLSNAEHLRAQDKKALSRELEAARNSNIKLSAENKGLQAADLNQKMEIQKQAQMIEELQNEQSAIGKELASISNLRQKNTHLSQEMEELRVVLLTLKTALEESQSSAQQNKELIEAFKADSRFMAILKDLQDLQTAGSVQNFV